MGWWSRATGLDAITTAASAFPNDLDIEKRDAFYSIGDPELAYRLGYADPGSPIVSEYTAMTLSSVYRAAAIVAGSIAGLPLRTIEQGQNGETTRTSSFLDNPGQFSATGYTRMTPFEWKEMVILHLLLHGNAYLQHIRNGAGVLVGLHIVHPLCVMPEWNSESEGGKQFVVSTTQPIMETRTFQVSEMTQIMNMSFDGLRGLSAISLARLSMGGALAGDKAAQRQFQNGALISGLVTPAEGEDLTADEATVVKNHINSMMMGPDHAGDIPVINRRLTFTPWTLSAADAQFIESRTFSVDEVGRWFGVPPHLLGLTEKSTSWGQGIAEQNRGLARYTLTPWTNRVQDRLGTLLPTGKWVEFDYAAFVKPSPEDEIKLLIEQVNSGLITLNEARQVRNLAPLEGGDKPRIPAVLPQNLNKEGGVPGGQAAN
jgi:HK97 family phage portal protein